jgi:hypothetical protein
MEDVDMHTGILMNEVCMHSNYAYLWEYVCYSVFLTFLLLQNRLEDSFDNAGENRAAERV